MFILTNLIKIIMLLSLMTKHNRLQLNFIKTNMKDLQARLVLKIIKVFMNNYKQLIKQKCFKDNDPLFAKFRFNL